MYAEHLQWMLQYGAADALCPAPLKQSLMASFLIIRIIKEGLKDGPLQDIHPARECKLCKMPMVHSTSFSSSPKPIIPN